MFGQFFEALARHGFQSLFDGRLGDGFTVAGEANRFAFDPVMELAAGRHQERLFLMRLDALPNRFKRVVHSGYFGTWPIMLKLFPFSRQSLVTPEYFFREAQRDKTVAAQGGSQRGTSEKTLNRVGKISTVERKGRLPIASDTAGESARGEAEQDRVPVASARRAWLSISLRLCRVAFTERLCREPWRLEQWLCVAADSLPWTGQRRVWLTRGSATRGQPARWWWGKAPWGCVAGSTRRDRSEPSEAKRNKALGGQT
jgi:hypothetical protein